MDPNAPSSPPAPSPRYGVHALWFAAAATLVALVIRNSGLVPVVLADEYIHSKGARLVPLGEAELPSYLYFAVYRLCNLAGDDFLACARFLNALFHIGALPFLFWTARRCCGPAVAGAVAVLALLGPFHSYTAYFMSESPYWFGFWWLAWFVTGFEPTASLRRWAVAGVGLGLLSLVKPHALLFAPALALHAIVVARAAGRTFALGLPRAATAVATMLATKMALGYALAGPPGLTLFGPLYGGIAESASSRLDRLAQMLSLAAENALGHVLALGFTVGLPLAVTAASAITALRSRATGPEARLALFASVVLPNLVAVTVLFTASVSDQDPTQVLRVHMRYYGFALPALLLVAAAQAAGSGLAPSRFVRVACALPVAIVVGWILFAGLAPYEPQFVDNPELFGLTQGPRTFAFAGWTTLALLAVWIWSRRTAAILFLAFAAPIAAVCANVHVGGQLALRRSLDAYDLAGTFARHQLAAEERSRLVVLGPNLPGVYRALFHVDQADATFAVVARDGSDLERVAAALDADWWLVVDTNWVPRPDQFAIGFGGFTLARTNRALAVDFRLDRWLGVVDGHDGLAAAESFGRWSDGDRVRLEFARPLPARATIRLVASAYGPNVGQPFVARIGERAVEFTLGAEVAERTLEFDGLDGDRTLTIEVPRATAPRDIGGGPDQRRLGLRLVSLEVTGG